MKIAVTPILALALAAGAVAGPDPDGARKALGEIFDEVRDQTASVAAEAIAAETLWRRADAVDHDIRVWNYKDRGLDTDRRPQLLPRVLAPYRDHPSLGQQAAAVFLEAAPEEFQSRFNAYLRSRESSGEFGIAPFMRPWPDHSMHELFARPLRTEAGVSLDLMTLLQQAEGRRGDVEAAVRAAEGYRPEVEERSGANRWTNEREWVAIERDWERAQEYYLAILEGIRTAAYLQTRGLIARHLEYRTVLGPERRTMILRRRVRDEVEVAAFPEASRDAGSAGGGADLPGFGDLASTGTGDGGDGWSAEEGLIFIEASELLEILPEELDACREYRGSVAYEVGELEAYEDDQEEEEEES